ncbi:hypothetical protein D9613_003239 [Agrocybe pediades]|uniref:Mitochondrial zinc maintenance protein 1, mitochondrial n=1 Tax=Agrocybe pediades TaxID=84607 RepID=A0A8H4VNW1_9AGAR|nr:hypothetical protein D9613_003239 [Agrocybe pediades]
MSLTPALKAATRSAYRDVLRAASVTFAGDRPVFQAFRTKIRTDIAQEPPADAEGYKQRIQFIHEVADVLRRNVVQGIKVPTSSPEEELYSIRMTKHTELGDNESIKNPPPMESSRSKRRKENGQPHNAPVDAAQVKSEGSPPPPRYYSALKKAHKERVVPELREEDLEESFVRGSGPEVGSKMAAGEGLDELVNPGLSRESLKAAKQRERERRRRKKAKKKAKKQEEENSEEDE